MNFVHEIQEAFKCLQISAFEGGTKKYNFFCPILDMGWWKWPYGAAVAHSDFGKIEFMLRQIDGILDEVSEQTMKNGEELSEYVKNLLSVMEFGVPYTAAAIMEKLGLRSKETFRKHYFTPAMNLHLVEMTVPDKPTSRNQRYYKL